MKFVQLFLFTLGVFLVSCSHQLSTDEYIESGQKMLKDRQWKAAIIELKNAVQKSPENPKARALLGEAYLYTFSSNAAIKEVQRAIELGYDKNSVLLVLGKAYEQKNENETILKEIKTNESQIALVKADIS